MSNLSKSLRRRCISAGLAIFTICTLGSTGDVFGQSPVPGLGNNFQIEGNLFSGPADDWLQGASGNGVLDLAGIPLDPTRTFHIIDLIGNANANVFAKSDKVFHDPNTYNWKTGSVPQKDDINNGLFHLREDGNGDLWAIMSGDRKATKGDSYIDFELLQNSLFMNNDGSFTSLGTDGGRTIGDLLLTIQFTKGGVQPSFFIQRWEVDAGVKLGFTYHDIPAPPGAAFVAANIDSAVSVPYGAFGSTTYEVNAFAEAAVNINALIPSFDSCFGISTMFIRTKSSQSATAQLKDLIAPIQLNLCLDKTPPILAGCPANLVLECDVVVPSPAPVTASDICDTLPLVDFSQDSIPGACAWEYTLIRKWVATDACGNADSCMQTITVQDTEAPALTCPANVTFECNVGGNSGVATATDNCDSDPAITFVDVVSFGSCEGDSTIVRTWTAIDCSGNSTSCDQTITYVDTTDPVITCPANVTFECNVGGDAGTATATDNCDSDPAITFVDAVSFGSCEGDSTIVRTWTATDCNGNSSSCDQTITYVDTTDPVITCPANVTFECNVGGNSGVATAIDNCDSDPDITFVDDVSFGSCEGDSTIVRTWTATDCNGNSSSCDQTITYVDTTDPVITCPANVTFECNAGGDAGVATATDNCDSDPDITFSDVVTQGACPQDTTIVRTWVATDCSGNADTCVQTITIQDTTDPVITCPANVTFECNVGGDAGSATATDNCDSNPAITFVDVVSFGSCEGDSTIVRTWTATDCSGNSSSCDQTITYVDTTDPVITCPANVTFECNVGGNSGVATATDNCDSDPDITFVDAVSFGSCEGDSTIVRTWTATDCNGNSSSCDQTITYVDTTDPVITCPANVTFECNAGGDAGSATATDNCDSDPDITSSDVVTQGACPQDTTIVRTWVATDCSGNADTCVQTITIQDTTDPVITCPVDITFDCVMGDASAATATDNCDIAPAITSSDDTTSVSCPLSISRTWTATDCSGNSAFCVQLIVVQDTTKPVISCPVDVTFDCVMGDAGAATATDNCGLMPTISSTDDTTSASCPLTISRTWTATDACGNWSSCVQTIIVQDTLAPVISCPADVTFDCVMGNAGTATATDICDTSITISSSDDTTSARCPLIILRTWTATDDCENSASCVQTIIVQDTTAPVLTCATDETVECGGEVVFTATTATDDCGDVTVTELVTDTTNGPNVGDQTFTRSWTAVDSCGNNSDTCTQTIILLACPEPCTFTIGGWGSICPETQIGDSLSLQPGCIRDFYFTQVFPTGVSIGDAGGYSAHWDIAPDVAAYLPDGSTPGILDANLTNPTTTSAGVLGSQILALTLNVEYSCAGVLTILGVPLPGTCYGDVIIDADCGGGKFDGITADSFLVIANKVVSGQLSVLDEFSASLSDVNQTATCLNEFHSDCDPLSQFSGSSTGIFDTDPLEALKSTDGGPALPTEFGVSQNFPNPFNPVTKIEIAIPVASQVSLEIFNVMGQKVATLVNGQLGAGYHLVEWDGSEVASGIYFYRIKAGNFVETRKMLLLK